MMEEEKTFKKISIWPMLVLSLITLGIYVPIWFLRRRDVLNKLSSSEKLGSSAAIFVLVIFCISVLFFHVQLLSTDQRIISALGAVDRLITLVGGIILLVLAFMVRRILDDHYNGHLGMDLSFSRVGTFFFGIFYLQYKMNRLPVSGRNEGGVTKPSSHSNSLKLKTKAISLVVVGLITVGIFGILVLIDSAESPKEWNKKGVDFYKSREYEKAIECFDKAIELNPNYVDGYYNRGNAYGRLEQYERALEDFNKVIDLDPYETSAYYNRDLMLNKLTGVPRLVGEYTIVDVWS